MVKACIVVPPSPYLDNDMEVYPLGPYYIKKYVEDLTDHTVDVLVEQEKDFSEYDIIGFSAVTANIKYIEDLLPLPDKITVLGGPHITYYRGALSKILRDNITYLVPGHGCVAFASILQGREPPKTPIPDPIDQIPSRDNMWKFKRFMYNLIATSMITSRGCPNNCYFCEEAKQPLSLKPLYAIQMEINECANLGYRFISISDDMFTYNLSRIAAISELMKKYRMKFRCLTRANVFTDKMAKVLANNGCLEIGFGAESASQLILNNINKRITVEQIERTINLIKDNGMVARPSFMIGLPGENHETIRETYNFIQNSRLDDFVIFLYHPYKGTYIYDHIEEFDLELPDDYDDSMYLIGKNAKSPNNGVRTSALSAEQLVHYHEEFLELKKEKCSIKN